MTGQSSDKAEGGAAPHAVTPLYADHFNAYQQAERDVRECQCECPACWWSDPKDPMSAAKGRCVCPDCADPAHDHKMRDAAARGIQ